MRTAVSRCSGVQRAAAAADGADRCRGGGTQVSPLPSSREVGRFERAVLPCSSRANSAMRSPLTPLPLPGEGGEGRGGEEQVERGSAPASRRPSGNPARAASRPCRKNCPQGGRPTISASVGRESMAAGLGMAWRSGELRLPKTRRHAFISSGLVSCVIDCIKITPLVAT